jgi:phosphoribosylglycinamide formyltransferase-1
MSVAARRAPLKLAIVISGRGSNMQSIARACSSGAINAQIVRVIADRDSAAGLPAARELGLATALIAARDYADRADFETALARELDASGAELIVLAGFMRILGAPFCERYAGRLLNIHPSLLPGYRGLHTHQRVLTAGERWHGATVHFVSTNLDGGPLLLQARVPVLADDTVASLSARVQPQEHIIYPQVLGWIAAGRLEWREGLPWLDGAKLLKPVVVGARDDATATV